MSVILLITGTQKVVAQPTVQYFSEGYSKVCENGKCALYDNDFKYYLTGLAFDDFEIIAPHISCYVKVRNGNKWAIFNMPREKVITDFKYDQVVDMNMSERYFALLNNGKWAIFDTRSDKEITDFKYDSIAAYDVKGYGVENPETKHIFKIGVNGKWGLIRLAQFSGDKSNMELVPAIYDDVEYFGDINNFRVLQNGVWYDYNRHSGIKNSSQNDEAQITQPAPQQGDGQNYNKTQDVMSDFLGY